MGIGNTGVCLRWWIAESEERQGAKGRPRTAALAGQSGSIGAAMTTTPDDTLPTPAPGLAGVMEAEPPRFSPEQGRAFVAERWGIDGTPSLLVSERDQNIRIDASDGTSWVLKISNAIEEPSVVDMEVQAVLHVSRVDPSLPVAVTRPTLDGSHVTTVRDDRGTEHLARLIPLLPGRHGDPEG